MRAEDLPRSIQERSRRVPVHSVQTSFHEPGVVYLGTPCPVIAAPWHRPDNRVVRTSASILVICLELDTSARGKPCGETSFVPAMPAALPLAAANIPVGGFIASFFLHDGLCNFLIA